MTLWRDEQGWKIPRRGTKSRLIYGLLKHGLSAREIADELGIDPQSTRVLIYKIRKPEWVKLRESLYRKRRVIMERIDTLLPHIESINDERDSVPLLIEFREEWEKLKNILRKSKKCA